MFYAIYGPGGVWKRFSSYAEAYAWTETQWCRTCEAEYQR